MDGRAALAMKGAFYLFTLDKNYVFIASKAWLFFSLWRLS